MDFDTPLTPEAIVRISDIQAVQPRYSTRLGAETARRIFGPHHQKVVTSSQQLARQLRTLYARLA